MTYPVSHPGPWGTSPTQAPGHLRGSRAQLLGIIIGTIGILLLFGGIVIGGAMQAVRVDGFQRVSFGGSGTIDVTSAGGYVVYYESSFLSPDHPKAPDIAITLTGSSNGQTLTLTRRAPAASGLLHGSYRYEGGIGVAMWLVHISSPDIYTVTAASPAPAGDSQLAFGRSLVGPKLVTAMVSTVGGVVIFAGLVTLVVGVVRRGRHKTELESGLRNGPPPGGYWQQQPQPPLGWSPSPNAPTPPGWQQPPNVYEPPPQAWDGWGQPHQPPTPPPGFPPGPQH